MGEGSAWSPPMPGTLVTLLKTTRSQSRPAAATCGRWEGAPRPTGCGHPAPCTAARTRQAGAAHALLHVPGPRRPLHCPQPQGRTGIQLWTLGQSCPAQLGCPGKDPESSQPEEAMTSSRDDPWDRTKLHHLQLGIPKTGHQEAPLRTISQAVLGGWVRSDGDEAGRLYTARTALFPGAQGQTWGGRPWAAVVASSWHAHGWTLSLSAARSHPPDAGKRPAFPRAVI